MLRGIDRHMFGKSVGCDILRDALVIERHDTDIPIGVWDDPLLSRNWELSVAFVRFI